MMDISFIVVNYNSLVFIKDLLKSFEILNEAKNTTDYDLKSGFYGSDILEWEIIIFDNGSDDGSTDFIKKVAEKNTNIVLIRSKTNVGFCKGSNEGAKIACGKYLVFLNPDTKIINKDIGSIINFVVEKETNGEKIGIIGVKTINADNTLQYSCRSFPTIARQFFESYFLFKLFRRSRLFGSYFMTWWDHQSNMEVDWVAGSFMFIRKEVFKLIGGFDEDFFMYSEDTDICFRLKRKGYKNYYFACYDIMHIDSAISSRNMVVRELGIWRSRRLYFKKNYSELFARIVSTFYCLGILNRLLLFFILYIFTLNKSSKTRINLYAQTLKLYFQS
ncbi:glycosyltransferase [bacterium]|nr:glycosyltransferase [bacterium]